MPCNLARLSRAKGFLSRWRADYWLACWKYIICSGARPKCLCAWKKASVSSWVARLVMMYQGMGALCTGTTLAAPQKPDGWSCADPSKSIVCTHKHTPIAYTQSSRGVTAPPQEAVAAGPVTSGSKVLQAPNALGYELEQRLLRWQPNVKASLGCAAAQARALPACQ